MGTRSSYDQQMHPKKRESDEAIAGGLGMTVEVYRERVAVLMKQAEEVRGRKRHAQAE
jgi:hypothetical protein